MPRAVKPTLRQIESQIKALKKQAASLRQAEVAEVIAKIKTAIDAYGLTAADLGLGGRGRRRAGTVTTPRKVVSKRVSAKKSSAGVSKYSDGQGNTWTGHGSAPTGSRRQSRRARARRICWSERIRSAPAATSRSLSGQLA